MNTYIKSISENYTEISFNEYNEEYNLENFQYTKKKSHVFNINAASSLFFGEGFLTIPLRVKTIQRTIQIKYSPSDHKLETVEYDKKLGVDMICQYAYAEIKKKFKTRLTDDELYTYCTLSYCLVSTLVTGLYKGIIPFAKCPCSEDVFLKKTRLKGRFYKPVCSDKTCTRQSTNNTYTDKEIVGMTRTTMSKYIPDCCIYLARCPEPYSNTSIIKMVYFKSGNHINYNNQFIDFTLFVRSEIKDKFIV
jgi:hypothetical protein